MSSWASLGGVEDGNEGTYFLMAQPLVRAWREFASAVG